MNGFILRSSISWYKCSNQLQALRFLSKLLTPVKSKHLMGRALPATCVLSEPLNKCLLVPYRTLYYLENEDIKEFKRFPSVYEVTQEHIKDICCRENPSSPEEWDNVKMEILSTCFNLTEQNFDSILMQVLLQEGELQLAHLFMDYMKKRKLKPNFVTLCKYMVLCSKNAGRVEQNVILETYDKIVSLIDTSVLDCRMVEFLVQGLCATDKWKKSLDYVSQLKRSEVTLETKNVLACAALNNKEYDLAWEIMNKWYKSSTSPDVTVFVEYMKFVINLHQKNPIQAYKCFTDLTRYAQDRNIILKEKAVAYIEEYFKRMGRYKTSYSKVDRDGICLSCRKKLDPCSLTEQEFSCLSDSFLEYSFRKSDVFINTTAAEFGQYCKFVDKYKPFDIVLDGLNVAHMSVKEKSRKDLARQLFHVVNHLSRRMNRILVLGRHHMKEWPLPIMRAIRQKAYVFYVSNSSQDDPFLIYAALVSGPKSLLVSDDMMRDHISRLPDPKLVHLFKKWQRSHQIYVERQENDDLFLMGPLKYDFSIQENVEKGWHIPFDNEMKLEPYEVLNNWLCVKKCFE